MGLAPDNPGQRLPSPPKPATDVGIIANHEAWLRHQQRQLTTPSSGQRGDAASGLITEYRDLVGHGGAGDFTIPADGSVWAFDIWYHNGGVIPSDGIRSGYMQVTGDNVYMRHQVAPLGFLEAGDGYEYSLHNSETFRADRDIVLSYTITVVPGTVFADLVLKAVRIGSIS